MWMDERARLQEWAMQHGLPFVDLPRQRIDPAAVESVPIAVAREHRVLPLKRESGVLWAAFADPLDKQAIAAVAKASDCRVIPVVALPSVIDAAIAEHYPADGLA